MTGFEEPDHEFATKEELLEAPQVKRFASWATFHRFSYCENALHDNSRLTLMAELNDGYEWWVCGYLTGDGDVSIIREWFPKWEAKYTQYDLDYEAAQRENGEWNMAHYKPPPKPQADTLQDLIDLQLEK